MGSPAGAARYLGLLRGEEQVGRVVLQRRELRYGQQRLRGGLSVDLLIDAAKAEATDALRLIFRLPRAETFDLVFHTYNENSAPIYDQLHRRFPNYIERFALLPYGLPLRARKALAGLAKVDLPGIDILTAPWRAGLRTIARSRTVQVTERIPAPEELSGLLDRFAETVGLHSVREPDVLRWRFGKGPICHGTVKYLRIDDRLVGYYATTLTTFAGAKFLALMDAVVDPLVASTAVAAIKRLALADALAEGCDMLFSMFNPCSPAAAAFIGFPFLPLPERLMKHRTPIFVLDVDRAFADVAARDDGYFLLTDLDYF
jgi:hypothetical protein